MLQGKQPIYNKLQIKSSAEQLLHSKDITIKKNIFQTVTRAELWSGAADIKSSQFYLHSTPHTGKLSVLYSKTWEGLNKFDKKHRPKRTQIHYEAACNDFMNCEWVREYTPQKSLENKNYRERLSCTQIFIYT